MTNKKGYPRFQHDNRSVEYKATGWKLEPDGKHITFTDGCGIGRLRLIGNKKQQIEAFPVKQIKRVRIVRRADGYYCQFGVQTTRQVEHVPADSLVGIDLGLLSYYTDSDGNTLASPRYYRNGEKKLKRLHRRLSRKKKGSQRRPQDTQHDQEPPPRQVHPGRRLEDIPALGEVLRDRARHPGAGG